MRKVLLSLTMLVLLVPTVLAKSWDVYVISAMHGYHKDHPSFNYDHLYKVVERLEPDLVGVEIRPEDIGEDTRYLNAYYPLEMVELAQRFSGRVFGFDWLGDAITGQPIPKNYWQTLTVKKLERELDKEQALMARRPPKLDELQSQQQALLHSATVESLMDGRYGQLTRAIDQQQQLWLGKTRYQAILDFNQRRDEKIAENIVRVMNARSGGTLVVVTGADHRTFIVENLERAFAGSIRIHQSLPVTSVVH